LGGVRWASAVGLLVACALSGCSGSDDSGSQSLIDAVVVPVEDAQNLTAAELATDTLWMTPGARLNTSAVTNLTILATLSGALPQTFAWNATLNGTGNLSAARMVLWLDLQNSALQPGVGGDPGCTAAMTLVFTINQTVTYQPGGCASLGTGSVPPGEHRLEFSTLLTSFPQGAVVAPGDGVVVQVAFGIALPQGVGYLLGGGDHDSHLSLAGLAEPVPN
jgi:hypothetical protein